ncbi:type II toxin-antitoxin system VapC family toxin [Candidatus Saccharibacteria bacterium]|nr:type II toxin-antitoxin system VapC family toxin [Candidatus Saccharibacteria bacterium]
MNKSVYLETSFISYLTNRPSHDLITAGHQALTQDWWDNQRPHFTLYVSELVVTEAKRGHEEAAAKRLSALENIELLKITDEISAFAKALITGHAIPEVAVADAVHVSTAAINGIDYLLTWNCKHIANAQRYEAIREICREQGYRSPVICTPEELIGDPI